VTLATRLNRLWGAEGGKYYRALIEGFVKAAKVDSRYIETLEALIAVTEGPKNNITLAMVKVRAACAVAQS